MKKIKLTESELTQLIRNIIKEQHNLSYDEFLEEMLQRGQNLIKLVEVIRKGNPNEMASWDVRTQEKALGEFREVAEFTTDLINEFKPEVTESKQPVNEQPTAEELKRDLQFRIDAIRNTQKTMVDKIDDIHRILTTPSKPWNK